MQNRPETGIILFVPNSRHDHPQCVQYGNTETFIDWHWLPNALVQSLNNLFHFICNQLLARIFSKTKVSEVPQSETSLFNPFLAIRYQYTCGKLSAWHVKSKVTNHYCGERKTKVWKLPCFPSGNKVKVSMSGLPAKARSLKASRTSLGSLRTIVLLEGNPVCCNNLGTHNYCVAWCVHILIPTTGSYPSLPKSSKIHSVHIPILLGPIRQGSLHVGFHLRRISNHWPTPWAWSSKINSTDLALVYANSLQ